MTSSALHQLLPELSISRWLVPLLADLAAHDGARFVELTHRLCLSRDSCARALALAQEQGWVVRNSGHGHPLRPEYILSEQGRVVAVSAGRIASAQAALGLPAGAVTRWGLPIVVGIAAGNDRFNLLSKALVRASPRALSQGLVALGERQLIDRQIVDGRPPTSRYALTENGQFLAASCSI